ncbi:hypothetical protein TrVE_jg1951 [Triparma verrucosa]|uniref:Uncharacterized protein n=2 Tax=Triparma TaxID=722752 RepID=A0A9W7C9R8_9STRA|nr:hypothetical protein TrVE_jg1951 [Triparma verrucosa]GMI00734.1 hypothetical protein TrST_g8830 [Triparma strigata]
MPKPISTSPSTAQTNPVVKAMIHGVKYENCGEVQEMYKICMKSQTSPKIALCDRANHLYTLCSHSEK